MVSLAAGHRQRRRQEATTGDPAALRGLLTTCRAAVGGLPHARRAWETVSGLTSESVAGRWLTGCSSGSGKRPRDTGGGSLPIGSHYV
jgi:hypothetical protein